VYTIDNPQSNINTWSKVIDRSCGISGLFETRDNFYISGGAESNNIYLIKFNNDGGILWERTFDGETEDRDKLVILKADLNDTGKGIWNKAANHEGDWDYANPYFITNCQDDSIIMAGKINFSKPNIDQDIYILKFDADGNHLWSRLFIGSGSEDVAWMIRETSDNGYIIGALTNSPEIKVGNGYDNLIIKLDGDGNLVWTKVYGINGGVNFTYDIGEDNDGNYVIAACDVMNRKPNIFKLDLSGNFLWNKILAHDYPCYAIHGVLRTTDNGGFVLTGKTRESFQEDYDIILYLLDSQCNIERKRIFNNDDRDDEGRIAQSFDGGYIVAAQTVDQDSTPRDYDIWFMKLDEFGRLNQ